MGSIWTGSGGRGPRGPAGAPGAPGAAGATGATGAPGAPGAPGATGATGATGADGATGATGAAGAGAVPGSAGYFMNVGANTIGVTSVGANFTAQNASGAAADGDMGSMASVDITGATVGIRTSQLVSIMRSGGYFEAVVRCPPVGTNNFPFVGFASTAYLTPGSGNPLTNTTSKVGFGAAGANWHAVVANGSAVVPVDLGASFVVSDLAAILFQVDIAKGGATVTLTATNMRTGAKQTVTATTGLPAANTPLATGIKADLPNITYAYLRGETRKA